MSSINNEKKSINNNEIKVDYKSESKKPIQAEIGWKRTDYDIRNTYEGKSIISHGDNAIGMNTGIESIRDAVYTTVYHEMGHGLCELIFDYLTTSDCLDEVFNSQQRLFRHILDNEEESVETFAWNMLDGNLEQDEINEMTELYIQYLKTA